jgi:hypothetical protein
MPVTRNVAWDEGLASFKGRDTAQYVLTTAALASTCAVCGEVLVPDEALSLLVNVTESEGPDGTSYVTFTDCVCHRHCSGPRLSVQRSQWVPGQLTPVAARMVLTQQASGGAVQLVPVLAYTLTPVVGFREDDGDLTSALVSILLFHGFQLAMSPDCGDILIQSAETSPSCSFTVTPEGLAAFSVGGKILYQEQLRPDSPDDALWLRAVQGGPVLVISGDNLIITAQGIDLRHAAAQGTLVIGLVHAGA